MSSKRSHKQENISDIGYKEGSSSLQIRIDAHKKYSNFSLEEWLLENLPLKNDGSVLDIGCGSGNMFETYSKLAGNTGLIVGIDQTKELLDKANTQELATHKLLLQHDMNDGLPFVDQSFDCVVSTFAIYYIDDVKFILEEIRRVLKDTATMLLIGPSGKNASELYEFNEKIFDFGMDEKILKRTERLEKEFFPMSKNIFQDVSFDKIDSRITFPTKDEFIRYYKATLLFEESVQKSSFEPSDKELYEKLDGVKISKEMVVLRGQK